MRCLKSALITLCLGGLMLSCVSKAPALQPKENPLQDLQLTDEQKAKLDDLTLNFTRTEVKLTGEMATALVDLAAELQREDRLSTDKKAAEAAKTANALVKKISNTYGELFKNRVKYVLDAKDVLTPAQRAKVLAGLERKVDIPKKIDFDDDFNSFRKLVGLDIDQSRKILRYRTDMKTKDLELALAIDNAALDLEAELAKEKPDSEKVNKHVMDIADLVVKMLDNRVDHFLKAKDVLTPAQKQKLLQMLKEK